MAGQGVATVPVRDGPGGTRPYVGAALLLGHRHPGGDADFAGGHLQFGVVLAAGQQRLVDGGEFRVMTQRRDDSVGHRDRADVPGFGCPHTHLGGPHDVGPGSFVGPRRGVQSVGDRGAHQFVIGRVIFDLVDAMAVAVVSVQDRHIPVREVPPALRSGTAGDGAQFGDLVDPPLTALPDQGLHQHR